MKAITEMNMGSCRRKLLHCIQCSCICTITITIIIDNYIQSHLKCMSTHNRIQGSSSEFRWPSGAGRMAAGRRSGGRRAPVRWPLGAGQAPVGCRSGASIMPH